MNTSYLEGEEVQAVTAVEGRQEGRRRKCSSVTVTPVRKTQWPCNTARWEKLQNERVGVTSRTVRKRVERGKEAAWRVGERGGQYAVLSNQEQTSRHGTTLTFRVSSSIHLTARPFWQAPKYKFSVIVFIYVLYADLCEILVQITYLGRL